jgi:type IV secretory pathway component VirB8
MNDASLDAWFARAREVNGVQSLEAAAPPGFSASVWQKHQRRLLEERAMIRTSTASLATALVVLATVVGFNLDALMPSDDATYVGDMASSVWEFTGD